MKAVQRNNLVIGKIYYDTDGFLQEPLIFKGLLDEDKIIFVPLKEQTSYLNPAYFHIKGSPFYTDEV